ncbi:MAG: DNA-3-methyladenine glycosylase I [Lacipirellulaceae bacterium]
MTDRTRCRWAQASESEAAYHDAEWGVPSRDPAHLFEMLSLEGAQAGLSWSTILNKRDGYRRAFAGFDAASVARFNARRIDRLVLDPSIVRHRGKIESVVANARAVLALRDAGTPLEALLWDLAGGEPTVNRFAKHEEIPAQTDASKRISKELKRRDFSFVGPTTIYAFMQAVGMVNDHTTDCFRWREVQ